MSSNSRLPTGSRFGYALPHEILLEVFGYHKESQSTLYAISLVCRQWMLCVTPLLYRHVRIWDTYRWATFILTLTRDKRSYNYGKLVSTLNLANDNVGALYGLNHNHVQLMNFDTSDDTSTTTITTLSTFLSERRTSRDEGSSRNHGNNTTTPSSTTTSTSTREHQVFVTTSSLMQIANTCKGLTHLDLSLTSIVYDSLIVETGEYLSTLQNYAVQPGLTQKLIPMDRVIEVIGEECPNLRQVIMQRCDWGSAQIIWWWVSHCQNLALLDARGCNKCTVKELVIRPLEGVIYVEDTRRPAPEEEFEDEQHQDGYFDTTVQPPRWVPAAPPALLAHTEPVPVPLRQVVHHIISEAKELGASDLSWFNA